MSTDKKIAKIAIDLAKGVVRFNKYGGIEYRLGDLSDDMVTACAVHGLKQKLNDSTASMTDAKGYDTTERADMVESVWTTLAEGNWNKPSEGKISKEQGITTLMEAKGLTREQAVEIWDLLHKAQ